MNEFAPHVWAVGAVAFFLGGVVKGASGMGLPVVAVSLLAMVAPVSHFLPLMAVPTIVSNIWLVWQTHRQGIGVVRLLWLIVPMAAATWFAAGFMATADPRLLRGIVGTAILVFVALSLSPWRPNIPRRFEAPAAVVFGIVTGAMGGLSGIFSPTLAMFLLSIRLVKDQFVAAMAILTLAASSLVSGAYTAHGLLTAPQWALSAVAFVPALGGLGVGNWVRRRVSPDWFRRGVLIMLTLLALTHVRAFLFG